MKKNAVVPYILIFAFGIVLVIILSFKGLGDMKEVAKDKGKTAGQKTETVAASKPEDIYKSTCIGCHGDQYQGVVGPTLKGVGKKYSKEQLINIVTKGKGGMPAGLVKPEQAAAMADWVANIK
jgi:cytochrome c550